MRGVALPMALAAWLLTPAALAANLDGAEKALQHGRYEEAGQQLKGGKGPRAALLQAQLALATGRYDEAASHAERAARGKPPVRYRAQLALAQAHLRRGRDEAALKVLRTAARGRDAFRAQLMLGRLHKLRGRDREAETWLYKLVEAFNDGRIEGPNADGLAAVAEAAHLLGATRDANDTFVDATAADPNDAEIQLAWADLFLDKYDAGQAGQSLKHVLERNPNHPRALERMARVLLESSLDFEGARELLDKAETGNPQLAEAFVTRAGMALRDMDLTTADAFVDRALAVNPRHLEALSVRAAVRFLADDEPGLRRAIAAVLAIHPGYSRMYSILARYAEWEHRYAELVKMADAALKLDPDDALAHATRGLNLLRLGEEEQGLASLRAAWERDRYNVHVYNTLNLYDDVISKEYESYKARPFNIRVHRKERKILEPYLGPLAQKAYVDMRKRYGLTPEGPLHLEFYANHEHFSVRTSGLPNLGVQGVCFGKVLTALSPTGGEFNWGQILWHELAHIFHIQLAKSRVPRWFTEGLAEYETVIARPEWKREDDRLVYDAFAAGRLPTLANFNQAFTRAKGPEDVMIAYYASYLAVDYLVGRFGFKPAVRMLKLWGQGVPTAQVFKRALKVDLAQLDTDFRAHLNQRFARYDSDFRVDLRTPRDLPALKEAALKKDANATDRADYAAALAANGDLDEAAHCSRKALELDPAHPTAHFILAHVALHREDMAQARQQLQAILAAGRDGYQLRMLLARIAIQRSEPAEALKQLEAAIALDGERGAAYQAMLELAKKSKDVALETRAVLAMSARDQHARAPLQRGLQLLSDAGRHQEVIERAASGIYLDPASPQLHLLWAESLAHTGKARAARTQAQRAVALAEGSPLEGRARLASARVWAALGNRARARQAAQQAAKLDPKLQQAADSLLSR